MGSAIITQDTINKTIEVGKINTLKILRQSENGFYLQSKDELEILLPNAYITSQMQIDNIISVFVYTDSEDRLIATTLRPKVMLDEFALLEVVDITKIGAFLDIGLPKDLFVPKAKQKTTFRVGDKKLIKMLLDEQTNRLIGNEKISSYISTNTAELQRNQKVQILVTSESELGYTVFIDNKYMGLVFKNEVFSDIFIGEKREGYVKNKRSDGKLDISLYPLGKQNKEHRANKLILDKLTENDNFLPLTYKSEAEDIQKIIGISKKDFKATLTKLLEKKHINLEENGIRKI